MHEQESVAREEVTHNGRTTVRGTHAVASLTFLMTVKKRVSMPSAYRFHRSVAGAWIAWAASRGSPTWFSGLLFLPDPRATLAYRCLSLSVGKISKPLQCHSGMVLLLSFVCITCDGPGGEGYLLHMLVFTQPKWSTVWNETPSFLGNFSQTKKWKLEWKNTDFHFTERYSKRIQWFRV